MGAAATIGALTTDHHPSGSARLVRAFIRLSRRMGNGWSPRLRWIPGHFCAMVRRRSARRELKDDDDEAGEEEETHPRIGRDVRRYLGGC
jgi:hypothetical protein